MASSQTAAFGLQEPSLIKFQGFINGKWVDAKNGEKIAVTNPATSEELGTVPDMGLAETQEAIDAAAAAFPAWSRTTAKVDMDAFFLRSLLNKLYCSNDMIFSSDSSNLCNNITKTSVVSSCVKFQHN